MNENPILVVVPSTVEDHAPLNLQTSGVADAQYDAPRHPRKYSETRTRPVSSEVTANSTGLLSPSPVRTLRGHTEGDARRLREQMANPVLERLVGVCHPFTLMHQLEPGLRS